MISRRWIMLYGLFVFFLLFVVMGNVFVNSMLKEIVVETDDVKFENVALREKKARGVEKKMGLTADDPAELSIFVQKGRKGYRSEMQWEFDMKKTMINADVLAQMEADHRIKGFKDSAAEFNKRLRRIESRIDFYENRQKNDPKNIEILDKLQNLYMLKSTMSVFKDKILIDSYRMK